MATSGSTALVGAGYKLPSKAKFIVVRAPADTDPSVFEGMRLKDLVEDDPAITKQIAIAYYKSEQDGFVQAKPAKSFALIDKADEEQTEAKVVRLERPAMIPPTNLQLSLLPYDTSVRISNSTETSSTKKSGKKRKAEEVPAASTVESSSKKKKKEK